MNLLVSFSFQFCRLLLLARCCRALSVPGAGFFRTDPPQRPTLPNRRNSIARIIGGGAALLIQSNPALAASDVTLVVEKQGDRVGLELYDVVIGTPPRTVVAIRRIVAVTKNNERLQNGMILKDFSNAAQVQERLAAGPYPVNLVFQNLAAQGDAISDLGTPMVTAQDALDLARRTSSAVPSDTNSSSSMNAYRKTVLSSSTCNIQSRRLDVLEIMYEARLNSPTGVIYDSSEFRGTGRPYQMVLGSGDMLPGVDQGLYDMCPGDVRLLQIPPVLAYGSRGNKLFRIPPDATLFWKVKLVSVNSVRQGDPRTRDEMEERAEY